MKFLNGFQEDDSPALPPPRPQHQPIPNPSSSSKRPPTLDLTQSPPLPAKRLRQEAESELEDDFEALFSKPAVINTAGPARFNGVAASGSRSAGVQSQERRSKPAASSSSSARGAFTSSFSIPSLPSNTPLPSSSASAANGFAKYANFPSQQQQQRSSSAFASGSGAHPQQFSTLPSPLQQPSSSKSYGHPHPQQRQSNQQAPGQQFYPPQSQYLPQQRQQQQPHPRQQAPPQSLGRIPIINSAATGRIPSAYLPTAQPQSRARTAVNPTKDYYRLQSASVSAAVNAAQGRTNPRDAPPSLSSKSSFVSHASSSNGKGKGKEEPVIDLTTSDAEEDSSDDVIVDDTPICIGQLTSLALILHPVTELQPPPLASPSLSSTGQPIPPQQVHQPPLPVHIYRGTKQGKNETLKLLTPRLNEPFGVMEHKVANVIAPLLGDGFSGTGVQGKPNPGQKVWCEASIVRRGERNVRSVFSFYDGEQGADLSFRAADDASPPTPPLCSTLRRPRRLARSRAKHHLPRASDVLLPRSPQRVPVLEPAQPRGGSLGTRRVGEEEDADDEWDLWRERLGRDEQGAQDGRGAKAAGRGRLQESQERGRCGRAGTS